MTEVVTNGAAFMQPFLQPHRQQAFGISNPDSPQIALQISAEASREHAALAAAEVPQASDDRTGFHSGLPNSGDQQPLPPRPKAAEPAPRELAAVPVGPSKARVELPPIQLSAPPPAHAPAQAAAPPAPTPAAPPPPQQSAPAPTAAPPPADEAPAVVTAGPLGPAEQLNTLALESMSENIIGVAFAPTQLAQAPQQDSSAAQRQKNFIFAQRKMFAETEQVSGKFAEQARRVTVDAATADHKFVEAAQPVISTVASGKFAAAESAQKFADKAPVDHKTVADSEVHLYDKVAPADTGNRFAPEDNGKGSGDQGHANRESLFQRAQAIAYSLGDKADNPEVKKLFADLERYKASMGVTGGGTSAAAVSPSVVVTA